MASMQAQSELAGIMMHREFAMDNGLSVHPSLEESYRMIPSLLGGLEQALGMIAMVEAYPELAAHIPAPGGDQE